MQRYHLRINDSFHPVALGTPISVSFIQPWINFRSFLLRLFFLLVLLVLLVLLFLLLLILFVDFGAHCVAFTNLEPNLICSLNIGQDEPSKKISIYISNCLGNIETVLIKPIRNPNNNNNQCSAETLSTAQMQRERQRGFKGRHR